MFYGIRDCCDDAKYASYKKAPGEDGFASSVLSTVLAHYSYGVTDYCLNILNNDGSLEDINHTNIVLIPKKSNLDNMTHFRPISLLCIKCK